MVALLLEPQAKVLIDLISIFFIFKENLDMIKFYERDKNVCLVFRIYQTLVLSFCNNTL